MDEYSDYLAVVLINQGVKPGDRIGILLPNIPQFVLAYFAILKAGAWLWRSIPNTKRMKLNSRLTVSGNRNHDCTVQQLSTAKTNSATNLLKGNHRYRYQ